jgi:hypothetical protein
MMNTSVISSARLTRSCTDYFNKSVLNYKKNESLLGLIIFYANSLNDADRFPEITDNTNSLST